MKIYLASLALVWGALGVRLDGLWDPFGPSLDVFGSFGEPLCTPRQDVKKPFVKKLSLRELKSSRLALSAKKIKRILLIPWNSKEKRP